MSDFPLELDHIFIWVNEGAPEAAALQNRGLHTDGSVHKHTGQGTSSVVFAFENAYLELIWLDDSDMAKRKGQEMGTDLLARADWRRSKASPFGVGLRRRASGADRAFPTRKYWAEWMKGETFILIAESSADVNEPLYFIVPDDIAVPPPEQMELLLESRPEMRQTFVHALGVRKLTNAKIVGSRQKELSATASMLSQNGVMEVGRGEPTYVELTFDHGARGEFIDAGPTLPFRLRY